MKRVLCHTLALAILASATALAGPADYALEAYRTPGFVLLVPEGELIEELGAIVETLYTSLSDLWLPDLGVCARISEHDQVAVPFPEVDRMPQAFSVWDFDFATRLPGSCTPDPCTVIVYRTAQDLDWDYCAFDVAGRYHTDADIVFDRDIEASMQRIADRLARPVDLPVTHSYASISGYPEGSWESILAHEFTHLLQYQTDSTLAEFDESLPVPFRLLFEGMAGLTQFRLGFRSGFDVTVLQPAARWIQVGGRPSAAPDYILYEVGATLVDAACRIADEATFWRIFSLLGFGIDPLGRYDGLLNEPDVSVLEAQFHETVGADWETYENMPFEERFELNIGVDWSAFLASWIAEMTAVEVTPAGEAAFEWLRRNVSLRRELLRPVLAPEALDRLAALGERVFLDDAGSLVDVDEADRLLATPATAIGEDTVDALAWRVPTLTKTLRRMGVSTEYVYGLSMLLLRADEDPVPYVEAFVEIVNGQLIGLLPTGRSTAD